MTLHRRELGQSATPENLANLREEMGLNRPALTRYAEWIGGILTGDMGNALSNKLPIGEQIGKRLGADDVLGLLGCALISVPVAILLGLVAVRYLNRWPDKANFRINAGRDFSARIHDPPIF